MERNYFVKCNHLWSLNSIWRLWCVYKLLQEDAQIIKTFKHNLGQIWFFFKSRCSEYTCATCWLWEKSKGIWYSPFLPTFPLKWVLCRCQGSVSRWDVWSPAEKNGDHRCETELHSTGKKMNSSCSCCLDISQNTGPFPRLSTFCNH